MKSTRLQTQAERVREGTFAGKLEKIKKHHEDFWKTGNATVSDVMAYLNDDSNHVYSKSMEDDPRWLQHNPPFRHMQNERLATNAKASIIGNRASFDTAQHLGKPERAGMSFIHLLGIAEAGIFNGVSLNHNSAHIIDEIIDLFIESWQNEEFRRSVINHQLTTVAGNVVGREIAELHFEQLRERALQLKADDFEFGLHLYPEHSVSHLHVHIIAAPTDLRQFSTFAHDDKTVDAREVRDYIKSVASNHISNQML